MNSFEIRSRGRVVTPTLPETLEAHEIALIEGGTPGVLNEGAILSALARPDSLMDYGRPDYIDLAASLWHGLSQAHGFVDGNKRTALLVTIGFLAANGIEFVAREHAPADFIEGQYRARNSLSQEAANHYLRVRCRWARD